MHLIATLLRVPILTAGFASAMNQSTLLALGLFAAYIVGQVMYTKLVIAETRAEGDIASLSGGPASKKEL